MGLKQSADNKTKSRASYSCNFSKQVIVSDAKLSEEVHLFFMETHEKGIQFRKQQLAGKGGGGTVWKETGPLGSSVV